MPAQEQNKFNLVWLLGKYYFSRVEPIFQLLKWKPEYLPKWDYWYESCKPCSLVCLLGCRCFFFVPPARLKQIFAIRMGIVSLSLKL